MWLLLTRRAAGPATMADREIVGFSELGRNDAGELEAIVKFSDGASERRLVALSVERVVERDGQVVDRREVARA